MRLAKTLLACALLAGPAFAADATGLEAGDIAVAESLREKALAGDLRAAAMLMSLRAVHLPDREGEGDSRNWAAEDRAILASFGLLEPAGGSDDPL